MINHIDLREKWNSMIISDNFVMNSTLDRYYHADVYIGLIKPLIPVIGFRGVFPNYQISFSDKIGCLNIRFMNVEGIDDSFLVIECRNPDYIRFFEYYIAALFVELNNHNSEIDELYSTIIEFSESWRNVFQKEKFTEDIGLFGELFFYYCTLQYCPSKNVKWNYPSLSSKDFSYGSSYFEVKTTTKRNVDTVEIHGIDQLDTPKGYKLFLPFLRVEIIKGGEYSIKSLVDLIGVNRFSKEQLKKIKHIIDKDNALEFNVLEAKIFEVDNSFPKMTREDLDTLESGSCIANINYTLDLAGIKSEPLIDYLKMIEGDV